MTSNETGSSNNIYKYIFENSEISMLIVEKDMTVCMVNEKFVQEFGYLKSEVEYRMKWTELVAPESLNYMTIQHDLRRKNPKQALSGYEFKYKTKSGKVFDAIITIGLIPGIDKSIASITNISELKRSRRDAVDKNQELIALNEELAAINEEFEAINEELLHSNAQLEKNELYYRTLFENTGSAIVEVEEDTTITLVNEKFALGLGYSRKEIEGKMKWVDLVPEADLEFMIKQHQLRRKDPEKALPSYEYRFKNKKGNLRDYLLFISIIPGTKRSIISLFDITQRKKAIEQLKISEEKYRTIFENIKDVFYQTDRAGLITEMSPSIENYSGFKREELIGKSVLDVYYDSTDRDNLVKALMEKGTVIDFELRLKTKDDKFLVCSTTSHLIYDENGNLSGYEGILRDITERKEAEIEKIRIENDLFRIQKMEVIGTLAGGIAHNFNNILMEIMGYTSLILSRKDFSHPDFEYLKNIERSVKYATELTRNLLGFARGGKYEVRPTNLNEIIQNEIKIFSQTRKDVVIHGKYTESIHMVDADQGQLRQVFLNLFINAWQAMPGGGNIYVNTENVVLKESDIAVYNLPPGMYVKISVTDTGTGIDKKNLDHIFTPFFSTKDNEEGTGLGLASVYGIVTNHGGIIKVYSEKGKGTTFDIFLPASKNEVQVVFQQESSFDDLIMGEGTILLVDDEKSILDLCEKLLGRLGYKTIKCDSGIKAVETYMHMAGNISMVLLDMTMPAMSGGETYDRLKEINPDVLVLLASGYAINEEAQEILNRGCRGFIQKPFTITELSKKIYETLN